jgi:hypothetical protein
MNWILLAAAVLSGLGALASWLLIALSQGMSSTQGGYGPRFLPIGLGIISIVLFTVYIMRP